MKKLSKRVSIAILLLSLIIEVSRGQDKTGINVNSSINLRPDSEESKIPVTITDTSKTVNFRIAATIHEGELSVEIYDPNGEKRGNFSISCQPGSAKTKKDRARETSSKSDGKDDGNSLTLSSSSSSSSSSSKSSSELSTLSTSTSSSSSNAQGQIYRSVRNPIKGNWIIKLIPKKAKGDVKIEADQDNSGDLKN
jgi:hypothetical protein